MLPPLRPQVPVLHSSISAENVASSCPWALSHPVPPVGSGAERGANGANTTKPSVAPQQDFSRERLIRMPSAPDTLGAIRGPMSLVRKPTHAVRPQPAGQRATRGASRGPSQAPQEPGRKGLVSGEEQSEQEGELCLVGTTHFARSEASRPAEPAWPCPRGGQVWCGWWEGQGRRTAVPFLLGRCQQSLGWAAFLQLREESQGDLKTW